MKTVWIYVARGLPYRARGSIGQSERPFCLPPNRLEAR